MVMLERGRVENGRLVFSQPLQLPEGAEVNVQIVFESVSPEDSDTDKALSDIFGMWRDREDMQDSVAWVEKERQKWQHRNTP